MDFNQMDSVLNIIKQRTAMDLPASYVRVLLKVASQPGITMPELKDDLGISQMATSRACKMLSRFVDEKGDTKGLHLIETHPDLVRRKRLAVTLSSDGQLLIEDIMKYLEETHGSTKR